MKNFYLSVGLLFVSLNALAQIINIPDANFKAKLLLASSNNQIAYNSSNIAIKIDSNNNGEIEVSEALLVKSLNINNANINSLVGITSFTNLRNLNSSNNSLISLDINSLSLLEFLDCSHNLLTSLSYQNSNNTIDYFDCSYNNLESLVLPNFFEFLDMGDQSIILNCSNNHLNSIVFNTTNGIEQFSDVNLDNNNFSTLTFPNLEILGSLSVSNNPLTNIDFTNVSLHSQVPDFHYGTLFLNNTHLTAVVIPFDISFGSSISNNQYLTYINFNNSQSNIDCYYQDEDETIYICDSPTIENNPLLDSICCDANELDYFSTTYPTIQVFTNCSLNTNGIENKKFTLYPNPTSSIINIEVSNKQPIIKTTINNLLGQTIMTFDNTKVLDISSLTKGTYFITIETTFDKETQNIIKL